MNGLPGVRAVEERLPSVREELDLDFVVANGENAADGLGITPKICDKLLRAGVDVITLGNHTWRRREIAPYLSGTDRVIRPANYSASAPGRGWTTAPAKDGTVVAVANVLGDLFLQPMVSPFEMIDDLVEETGRETPFVIVDFHAEATSEKVAMALHLDGRVTAVLGTHTHIQTNDARVLPGGTAAITDAGMTGPHESVIGVKSELAIKRMLTGIPVRFETAEGDVRIEGALLETDGSGRATSCETFRLSVE